MSGRTNYWPKDSAWWRRERIVAAGIESVHAPAVMDWIVCEAKAQNPMQVSDGIVKVGYTSIAHGATFGHLSADQIRPVVSVIVRVGLLDDFEDHGDTFTARISGWHDDVVLTLEAARRAAGRARQKDESGSTEPNQDEDERPQTSANARKRPRASSRRDETRRTSSSEDAHSALPEDLPEPLHATAAAVRDVLARIAATKPQAQAVTLAAVGRALATYPDRAHLDVAGEVEHYWCHGSGHAKTMRDVVQTYRNRLKVSPIVARPALSAVEGGGEARGGSFSRFATAPQPVAS